MTTFTNTARGAIIALGLVAGAAIPTSAAPVTTYTFNGTFEDGATASGQITIAYGFLGTPTAILTTSGIFGGFDYVMPDIPTNLLSSNHILVLSEGGPDWYQRYLYLDFSDALGLGGDMNPLIASSSFECDAYASTSFACTGGQDKIRYFASGVASVPEPVSLSILGAGMAGMVMLRRRKKIA